MTRFYNLLTRRMRQKIQKWSRTWGITFIVLATAVTNSFTQCDQSFMACNDFVQISMNDSCFVVVTPDMILENPAVDPAEYSVTVWDGNFPIGNTITEQYVNRVLEVRVRCLSSGVSCWGYIGIEDKLPPQIDLFPPMLMLTCNIPEDILELTDSTGNVFALLDSFTINNGGCEKIDSLILKEVVDEELGACGEDGVLRTITRTYIVVDNAGNEGSADQVIVIKKAELSDLNYPGDTVISCIDANGFDPDVFGRPDALSCDIFESIYTDIRFPLCDGSFNILRTWIVVDWCDNKDTSVTQVLESLDTIPPAWNLASDAFDPGSTDAGSQNCIGSITLPFEDYAAATDLCYALQPEDYTVRYRKGDSTTMDEFEAQIRTDVDIDSISRDATISNLPLGSHKVIITATDACGNSHSVVRTITIEDNTPPNAVCERTTTVGLDFNGFGELMAFSIDDHSFDNCGIDRFEVKRLDSYCDGFGSKDTRNDLEFGPSIHFCCADIPNNPIRVVLRVYDINDKFSECVVDVIVQDKRLVVLNCQNDITVNCDFNFNTLEMELGTPSVQSDVCLLEDPVLIIPEFTVDECGNGMFYVTWTISDFVTIRDSCKQKVTVRNLSSPTISIPGDLTIEGCDASLAHPAFINGEPSIIGQDCEIIAISHHDHVDNNPPSGCIHIKRSWTIIDWCTYDPLNPSTALSQGIQNITLADNEAPVVLDCPSELTVIDSDENCFEMVDLQLLASDNCTHSEDLVFAYFIDLNNDGGSPEIVGATNDASDIFPAGTHRISWRVKDQCGNVKDQCWYTFTVSNPFNPEFTGPEISLNGIFDTDNLIITNIGASITENCADTLFLSFAQNQQVDEVNYGCSDIPDGVSATVVQNIYVSDALGNQRVIQVNVLLTDTDDICPDTAQGNAIIIGVIKDENDVLVPNVSVRLIDASNGSTRLVTTDQNGNYRFENLASNRSYSVVPELTGNDVLGVSTVDLVLIQRHILNLQAFESLFRMIAADINNSESISASDLVLLQKLILGFDEQLTSNDPWRFVPSDHVFDLNDPYDFPESKTIRSLKTGVTNVGFIGVKIGDVNGNAFPALLDIMSNPRSKVTLKYTIGQLSEDVYKVQFKFAKAMEVTGFQFGFDAKNLNLLERDNGLMELRNDNIFDRDGKIKISWSDAHGRQLDQGVLFTFLVGAKDLDRLELDRSFSAELYDANLEIYRLALEQERIVEQSRSFEVFQNHPNPFSKQTNICFLLPERDNAELKIYDITGRLLMLKSNTFERGINQFRIDHEELGTKGVLYYTIETSRDIKGHKMILLQ